MSVFLLVLKIFLLTISSIAALLYILFQFYQKKSPKKLEFKTLDYVIYAVLALCFGLGTGNYFGLLAFAPLLLLKVILFYVIDSNRIGGSGFFVSVSWRRFLPKGFGAQLPKQLMSELNRLPTDKDFIVPFFFLLFALFVMEYQNKKQMKGSAGNSQQFSKSQMDMAQGLFIDLMGNLRKLQKGQREKKSFPFGVLTVERL